MIGEGKKIIQSLLGRTRPDPVGRPYTPRPLAMPDGRATVLPPIPDPEKDYVLGYDSTDGTIKWVETTEACPEE